MTKILVFLAFSAAVVGMIVWTMGGLIFRDPAHWWWLPLLAAPLIGGVWWMIFRPMTREPTTRDTVISWFSLCVMGFMVVRDLPPAGWWWWFTVPFFAVFCIAAWAMRAKGVKTAEPKIVFVSGAVDRAADHASH